MMISMSSLAQGSGSFDWNDVIDAIIKVESKGKANAVNGNGRCVGILQITPVLVKECNDILKSRGDNKRYTLGDRYSENKSREMFVLIQSKYNPSNNVENGIRLWNCGISALKNKSKGRAYLAKVMRYFNGRA